ncbi:MAG: ATP-binding protein [candidate division Zixibacteria bacterium]|nr:ATP-binding protein [candidate division Zixibacteria bacterium]
MIASQQEILSVLRQYNPWWDGRGVPDLPSWKRAVFSELRLWLTNPPANRAVMLSGARQVGKTTLFLQVIQSLLNEGVRPEQILYVTFDHPLFKLVGLDEILKISHELQPRTEGREYLLLDEIQYIQDWQSWLKHQVDFDKKRRIAVTGSAIPLANEGVESGVGRWHTIKLATLSFFEYLQIKKISQPNLPQVSSLTDIFAWDSNTFIRVGEMARPLVAHFHQYLLRGGFPQTALVESISVAQRLIREDIIDKVLKRDMTATFGVRRILQLEKTFLYLCLHDGGILDVPGLCKNLGMTRPTVNRFIDLLEAAHLIYKLVPHGYGKEILRARHKVYLADAAIAGSVLLKGKALIEDSTRLGAAVETAFFKHVFTRYYQDISVGFSYWRGKRDIEVDIVAEVAGEIIPFEVKYQQSRVTERDLKGIREFSELREISRAYVVTRDLSDFGTLPIGKKHSRKEIVGDVPLVLKIPAPLACYWLSQSEVQ